MKLYLSLALLSAFLFASNAFGQNTFEGYNVILSVPENQRSTACALRYAPPATAITVADLDTATPLKLTACGGSGTNIQASGSTATIRANPSTFKWCFQGEDKRYRISFRGDQWSENTIIYDWIATPADADRGFYNVRDFGAAGDGRTDDTAAIRSALAYAASRNGGTVFFPEGDYHVGSVSGFDGIAVPSGVTIQGVAGLHTGAATNNVVKKNPSRITLNGSNRALFKIGECTEKVAFKDIELLGTSQQNTVGVEALGAYNSSQDFYFENVAFSTFWRGIYAHGLTQTNLNWQFDYIHIDRCRFVMITDTAIYTNVRNSDWRVQNTLFVNPRRTATQKADSMYFERVAGILVDNTVGGGFVGAIGGTFLNILDSSNVLVSHSQTEAMTNSFIYNEINHPQAGDLTGPVTFLNSMFSPPIIFNARRTFVSTGNHYGPRTFRADERLRVYSTGDRFCYDGFIAGCTGGQDNGFDRATVVFRTGQPGEGSVRGYPAFFGTDVHFGAPVKMPSFLRGALPAGKENGSMVYCQDCRRATTPCQAGGSGAPAMMVGGQWSCL